jgi:hypothetical protein
MSVQAQFDASVEHGFQASSTWQQGKLVASESGAAGPPMSTVPSCSWALSITPKVGWGAAGAGGVWGQKATAGWLSALAVFEPHWQVGRIDELIDESVLQGLLIPRPNIALVSCIRSFCACVLGIT